MGLLEFAIFLSAGVALYNFQQIKMALKDKGYHVDMLTGWWRDYRQFKTVIEKETDRNRKINYQKHLNGLHFSLIGIAVLTVLILRKFLDQ